MRLVRSGNARRVGLRVDPARGDICLVCPRRASERTAWQFALDNRAWIDRHLAKMEQPVAFTDGAVIPVFGIERTIRVVKGTSRVTSFELTDGALIVTTTRPDPATNIRRYLYQLMEDTAWTLARAKAASIDRPVVAIQLRDTRTRWGSCSPDGRLMLCWRLVFAPMHVIDYVVAHECAHLKHMNHSKRFWLLCEGLSEQMEPARDWLDFNGNSLLRFGSPG